MQESIFDKMPQFVELFVVSSLFSAIFTGRDYRFHTLLLCLIDNGITIIPFITKQVICIDPFNQAASLRTIRSCTLRDNDSDRHTMRIHGQMYFGVEPPFVRLIS